MHWGIRRWQYKDGRLTPEGYEHYKYHQRYKGADKDPHKKGFDQRKAALALNAVTALYNPVSAANLVANLVKGGAARAKTRKYEKERSRNEIDKETGFHLKSNDLTPEQDLERVNPGYGRNTDDVANNCMLCTATYELRRRGYDVTANEARRGFSEEDLKKWFPKATLERIPKEVNTSKSSFSDLKLMYTGKDKEYAKKVINNMSKQPNGSRGNLMVNFFRGGSGHSVFYEIQNGKLIIRDSQINKTYNDPIDFLSRCSNVRYARLDNVDFNNETIRTCSV